MFVNLGGRDPIVFPSFSLAGGLAILWLLLSGHYSAFILLLGLISVALVVLIARRLDVIDQEGHPVHLTGAVLRYWPWLIKEIIVANIDVAKAILKGGDAIQPQVFTVKASQASELGHAIYANSITLTPGTLAIGLEGGEIVVHALTTASADGVKTGDMDRRVTNVVDAEDDI